MFRGRALEINLGAFVDERVLARIVLALNTFCFVVCRDQLLQSLKPKTRRNANTRHFQKILRRRAAKNS